MKTFGIVNPSVVSLPWDLQDMLPEDLRVAVSGLNVQNGKDGEFERAIGAVADAVAVLVHENARAVIVFGVPIAAKQGYHAERTSYAKLAARFHVPLISSLGASILGLQAIGARKPVVITQYDTAVNERIDRYFSDAGLPVFAISGLGASNAAQVNQLRADDFYELAKRSLAEQPSADAVFLSARTNLQDVSVRLEAESGIPVVHQGQAALWWALAQLGLEPAPNQGRLLQRGMKEHGPDRTALI